MKDTQEYWNPLLETLPREKLRALQLKKFRRIFQWAYDHSKFHRSLYKEAGIKGGIIGRDDDITKVKGVLLAPTAIEDVVRSINGLGNEYKIVVDRVDHTDRITLKVELAPEAQEQKQLLETKLKDRLRLKTNLGYNLEFHQYGTLPRYQVKAKRFTDLRKRH